MGHLKYDFEIPKKAENWIATHGLIDYGGASLSVYCAYMDISDQTHYRWLESKVEYVDAIKNGKEKYKGTLKQEAVRSLLELVKGYKVEEKRTEYVADYDGNPMLKNQVITTKHIQKNTAAVIFALTNLDPEHWKNRQQTDNNINANVRSEVEADVTYGFDDLPDDMLYALADKMQEAHYERKKAEKQ